MRPVGTPAIEVSSLRVRYGRTIAVEGLDLTAAAGEIVALLGPNGAGKTSTVEAIEGYRRPDRGRVRVLGLDPANERRALSPHLGVMLQQGGVSPGMAPAQALKLFASYYRAAESPGELLQALGLQAVARTPWRRLSGGEQQRLSLGLALVGRPLVAVLDEPTSGVDPEGREVVRHALSDLRHRGACVLLTTHELDEAERVADRVFILARGRLLASGTLDELAALAGPPAVRWASRPGAELGSLEARLGAPPEEESPGHYAVAVGGDLTNATAIAAVSAWCAEQGLPIHDLHAGRLSLEQVYLRLVGPSGGAGGELEGRR